MATVLVADDDSDLRDILINYLEIEGHHVLAAADGQEMIDHLRQSAAPLVVLADQYMPRVSARHLLALMNAAPPELARHAFIFMTGAPHALPPMPREACPETFFAVMAKPFNLDELKGMLVYAIGRLDGDTPS